MDWAGRYEVLRQQVRNRDRATAGWGLALLIHRGVAAWMDACSAMAIEPFQPRRAAEAPVSLTSLAEESARQPPSVLPEVSGQVVNVLAQMILETRQEVLT